MELRTGSYPVISNKPIGGQLGQLGQVPALRIGVSSVVTRMCRRPPLRMLLRSMKKASITRAMMSILITLVSTGVVASDPTAGSLWVRHGQLTQSAMEVVTALRHVESFGLDPRDFADSLLAITRSGIRQTRCVRRD